MKMSDLVSILTFAEKSELLELLTKDAETYTEKKTTPAVKRMITDKVYEIMEYLRSIGEHDFANVVYDERQILHQESSIKDLIIKFINKYKSEVSNLARRNPNDNILIFLGFENMVFDRLAYYYVYKSDDNINLQVSVEKFSK